MLGNSFQLTNSLTLAKTKGNDQISVGLKLTFDDESSTTSLGFDLARDDRDDLICFRIPVSSHFVFGR
jgi:hypothetical protein